ncbi:hypothetical protein LTR10_006208 [Elasticomyces elasticus]|nr:hypothetical protein LTR10_006208 [Elasticomyces elasticus]KAK4966743.1 hypothetical protein LTR42_011054 [Elasticomyces elasticus]
MHFRKRRRLAVDSNISQHQLLKKQPKAAHQEDPTNTGHTSYQYANDLSELNTWPSGPSDQIRLLRTIVHLDGEPSCILVVFPLSAAPDYAALSYSWGAGDQSSVILTITEHVHDEEASQQAHGSTTITKDLQTALRRVQRHNLDIGWLWIDAICVDQANTKEKTNQVSMMRTIYQQAQRVYVWLGEGVAVDDTVEDIDVMHKDDFVNLLKLEERAWWFRLWAMQEMALAKDVIVCLGKHTFSWNPLVHLMTVVMQASWFESKAIGGMPMVRKNLIRAHKEVVARLKHLDAVRKSIQTHGKLSLWLLLTYSAEAHASVPLDKIIGLLGLVPDGTRAYLRASYNATPATLFMKACTYIIDETQSLDILVGRWPRRDNKTANRPDRSFFPSWVPDFAGQIRRHTRFSPGSFLIDEQDIMSDSGSAACASGNTVPRMLLSSYLVMTIEALLVGQVCAVQITDLATSDDRDMSANGALQHLSRSVLPFILENVCPSQRRELWRTLASSSTATSLMFQTNIASKAHEGIWLTLIDDTLPRGRTTPLDQDAIDRLQRVGYDRKMFEWLHYVGELLSNRVFFRTHLGYVGVANTDIQEGDLAIVPFGPSVPFLLREVPGSPREEKRYTLIDGCIIHAVMDGELMHAYEAGEVQSKWFGIV